MRSLAVLVAVAALVTPARAGSWPTPAAGTSASGDPEVILTFDDGPHPRTTPRVLEILGERDLQAVFFMVGQQFQRGKPERNRAIVQRMLRDGHIVANHTMTHPQMCAGTDEAAATEIDAAREILEREAGMPVPWFRTPFGAWCPRMVQMLGERGLMHWYWDIDPQEWRTGSAKATEKRVIAGLKRLRGRAVILLHDTKAATVKALPKILDWIEAENAKRKKAGGRPIRIIPPTQYARELIGEAAIAEAEALGRDLADGLASGLASALP